MLMLSFAQQESFLKPKIKLLYPNLVNSDICTSIATKSLIITSMNVFILR